MSANQKRTIVIIGAGFSGTLTAVNLLLGARSDDLRIVLVDQEPSLGRGLAYRLDDDNLLLNVPAGNMSALADQPDHFVAFCHAVDPAFNGKSFISRRLYGEYLQSTLADAEQARPGLLERITAEAVAVVPASTRSLLRVRFSTGLHIDATQVVLALGHFPPRPPSEAFDGLRGYINNPWDFDSIDRIDPQKPIAILGMGHTAIDALFHVTSCNPSRKVLLLSRRGLLPHCHRINPQPPSLPDHLDYLADLPVSVLAYARAVRREIRRRESAGGDWRDVINELRPHTARLWEGLAETERRKFMSRIMPYWDIHRHRLAPVAARRLKRLIDSGQASKRAGHIVAMQEDDDGLVIRFRERHPGDVVRLEVGATINCTGPCYDISLVAKPLIVQLRSDGLIQQDSLHLGLRVDENYQVIGSNDRPTAGLFYVGPMLKARYWEAIAVPELRKHARQLATYLILI